MFKKPLLLAVSFVDALLDTHPYNFNESEENRVINKYLPERSITKRSDFEDAVYASRSKGEQHYSLSRIPEEKIGMEPVCSEGNLTGIALDAKLRR